MRINKILFFVVFIFCIFSFVACEKTTDVIDDEHIVDNNDSQDTDNDNEDDSDDGTGNVSSDFFEYSVAKAMESNKQDHADASDCSWAEANVREIVFNTTSITASVAGVSVSGTTLTIGSEGTYRLTGKLADGRVIVDTKDDGIVRLLLNGVDIASSTSAPIYVKSAEKTVIVLVDGTINTLSDAKSYVYASSDEDEPKATIFSADDLSFCGSGSLTVVANYNDAISCKDGLVISDGSYSITSVDDGIRGKDYLVVNGGSFKINVTGDGMKSDNDDDASKGYILLNGGVFNITAKGDGINAETDLLVGYADVTINCGGGSGAYLASDASAKGLKGLVNLIVDDGVFNINSADDALHSNGNIAVNGGELSLSTGDDGLHADAVLTINTGKITVTKSYEGIESAVITINGGNISVVSSDDGINVAGGNDSSGNMWQGGPGGGRDNFSSNSNYYLYINGGYICVNATGDGLDANGSIVMTGGTVLVNGPTNDGNGALDYDASFSISGGVLIASGSSGMAQAPSNTSTQCSVMFTFGSSQQANNIFRLENSDGTDVVTFAPAKTYKSIVVSSPKLQKNSSYNAYLGGSCNGSADCGLYTDGTYSVGSMFKTFSISNIVTTIRN